MKTLALALGIALFAGAAPAGAAPASAASLRELLEITESRRLVEGTLGQMDALMQQTRQQAMQGIPATPEVEAVIDRYLARSLELARTEMSYDRLEPRFIEIYQRSFTQEEVDGMLAFYRTPVGRSVIAKMPQVMQHAMGMVQEIVVGMVPKMRANNEEMMRELKALKRE